MAEAGAWRRCWVRADRRGVRRGGGGALGVVIASVVVPALAGCSGGSGGTAVARASAVAVATPATTAAVPAAAPTVTTSTTADPAPAVPALPARPEARHTAAGAATFARYFWAVDTYAYQSLDPAPLVRVSGDDCRYCKRAVKAVQRLEASGNAVVGNGVVVHTATAKGGTVATVISRDRGKSLRDDGTKHTLAAEPKHPATVRLTWTKGTWRVAEVVERTG